MNKPDHVQCQQ